MDKNLTSAFENDIILLQSWIAEAKLHMEQNNYEDAAEALGAASRMLQGAESIPTAFYDLRLHVYILSQLLRAVEIIGPEEKASSLESDLRRKTEELNQGKPSMSDEELQLLIKTAKVDEDSYKVNLVTLLNEIDFEFLS